MSRSRQKQKASSMPNIRERVRGDFHAPVSTGSARTTDGSLRLSLSTLRLGSCTKFSSVGDLRFKAAPFNVRWIYNFNWRAGVINLNYDGSTIAFYAASNCGVYYNWTTNRMRLLQGHRHTVTCITADARGKWLVTADSGPENVVVVWDSQDLFPQRSIYLPHGNAKTALIAMSGDAKFLLTLAYPHKTEISWWIWSYGKERAHVTVEVDTPRDSVIKIGFNPYNSLQFLLLTKMDIWVGEATKINVMERGVMKETDDYQLSMRMPPRTQQVDSGRLTDFTFVETSQLLVSTSRGLVLIYGFTMEYPSVTENCDFENLKYIKSLKIETKCIKVIKCIDGVIVTGNSHGEIHFYDFQLKLLYWAQGFQVGCIKGLSFNLSPRSYVILDPKCGKRCPCVEEVEVKVSSETGLLCQKLIKKELQEDCSPAGKPFIVRDFIVWTHDEGVKFVNFVTERATTILDVIVSNPLSITVHPEKISFCVSYESSDIELIDFVRHKLLTRLNLKSHYTEEQPLDPLSVKYEPEHIVPHIFATCVQFSPSGLHLACGLNTGQLIFLDPTTINVITPKPYHDTQFAVKNIAFSPDSLTLAFYDVGRTVLVYKYDCDKFIWKFIGKHRAHHKEISSVFFLNKKNDNGEFKLLSIGTDCVMVEYDIGKSENESLPILSLDRIEQRAVPLHAIPWPNPSDLNQEEHHNDLPLILIANSENKYKVINYGSTMTMAVALGPRYDSPVSHMMLVHRRKVDQVSPYLLFATKNVVGLQKMPLDGNPWKHNGILAFPNRMVGLSYREDSGTLFTIGTRDACVCQWAANYRAVDQTELDGGKDLDPYYCLIENGRPGWLFQEIRDHFYYIQILCQGTFSPAMRRVKDYIPIDSLPDMMRALGFFLTEFEVENLVTEAKYKVYQKQPSLEIDFEEFVKLYLNHRPAFGDSFSAIKSAFNHFAELKDDQYYIQRDDFIDILADYGENFSRELSWYLLSILSGHSFEDRANMTPNDFTFLPEEITFDYFITVIIGIQEVLDDVSFLSTLSVQSSAQTSSMGSGSK